MIGDYVCQINVLLEKHVQKTQKHIPLMSMVIKA